MIRITKNWANLLKDEFEKPYFKQLQSFLADEYSSHTVYPAMENIFNALNAVKYEDVKVVIIGQDPYHEPNQAHGLAFSVQDGVEIPPSLVNIYKEIESDLNIKCEQTGNLTRWAKQGVLLLNTSLTVRRGQANSHRGKGWETFTNEIIKLLSKRKDPMVFIFICFYFVLFLIIYFSANLLVSCHERQGNHLFLKSAYNQKILCRQTMGLGEVL